MRVPLCYGRLSLAPRDGLPSHREPAETLDCTDAHVLSHCGREWHHGPPAHRNVTAYHPTRLHTGYHVVVVNRCLSDLTHVPAQIVVPLGVRACVRYRFYSDKK